MTDTTSRIAICSAFEPELAALIAETGGHETRVINQVAFTTGELEGHPVVLFLSGVSMVNAAMAAQMALDHFDIQKIVFSGIAGGAEPALGVGDVVVPAKWASYLDMYVHRDGAEGPPAPSALYTPRLPGYGDFYPRGVSVFQEGAHPLDTRLWFDVDPALLDAARRAAAKVALDQGAGEMRLSHEPKVVVGGAGVSGPAFVDNRSLREYLHDAFDARVIDMETAAVAQVAFTNRTPFIAFRSLSDLAGGGDGENEFTAFLHLAAGNAAKVVHAYLREL